VARIGRRGWLAPLVLFGALAVAAIPLVRALRRPLIELGPRPDFSAAPAAGAAVRLMLPDGERLELRPGSASYQMASFLAGVEPVPARFALAPFNFRFASAEPTPESMATLDEVAAILRAYPSATVRVESYTDSLGAASANLDLSRDRSETVKGLLLDKGIDPARVATAGLGPLNPVASNETERGRAENRRTEIVVTGR
ncbi:MAG TPA: OmpA family protein, partial [Polyangia bacterium]|nr:OmpA family protein [Polyangia bacterium]